MGNASKWFCGLVCLTKHDASDSHNSSFPIKSPNQKWRWSFLKSYEDNPQQWAAIKIQAAFRACLARRALRALKGLVMLQALVRAEIDRKRTAEFLQRMHPFSGAQARARAARACAAQAQFSQASWTAKPSSTSHIHGPATPDKFESPIRFVSMKFDHPSLVLKVFSFIPFLSKG
ncbi:PREDICTED: uncharacterized protein LOC109330779 [Lupinus angustifolius]|uniref:uncharacterized protein LOC109330779 n=1 Tax=Lupinus angustifolius TaxID=3871 RepID=UPI00092F91DF|nr:PREDICTED: uncharacterized protein LOC109330779 [Lupinus angustifolius]